MIRYVLGLAMALVLSACASSDTMRSAPDTAGTVRVFQARYDAVTAATLDSIRGLNINVTSSEETPTGLVVLVSKPVSAFSWGEVGRVIVPRSTGTETMVRVYWEKRSTLQITGTGQAEAAEQIYAGIQMGLERARR